MDEQKAPFYRVQFPRALRDALADYGKRHDLSMSQTVRKAVLLLLRTEHAEEGVHKKVKH